jgi:hypothetical protein
VVSIQVKVLLYQHLMIARCFFGVSHAMVVGGVLLRLGWPSNITANATTIFDVLSDRSNTMVTLGRSGASGSIRSKIFS